MLIIINMTTEFQLSRNFPLGKHDLIPIFVAIKHAYLGDFHSVCYKRQFKLRDL